MRASSSSWTISAMRSAGGQEHAHAGRRQSRPHPRGRGAVPPGPWSESSPKAIDSSGSSASTTHAGGRAALREARWRRSCAGSSAGPSARRTSPSPTAASRPPSCCSTCWREPVPTAKPPAHSPAAHAGVHRLCGPGRGGGHVHRQSPGHRAPRWRISSSTTWTSIKLAVGERRYSARSACPGRRIPTGNVLTDDEIEKLMGIAHRRGTSPSSSTTPTARPSPTSSSAMRGRCGTRASSCA